MNILETLYDFVLRWILHTCCEYLWTPPMKKLAKIEGSLKSQVFVINYFLSFLVRIKFWDLGNLCNSFNLCCQFSEHLNKQLPFFFSGRWSICLFTLMTTKSKLDFCLLLNRFCLFYWKKRRNILCKKSLKLDSQMDCMLFRQNTSIAQSYTFIWMGLTRLLLVTSDFFLKLKNFLKKLLHF